MNLFGRGGHCCSSQPHNCLMADSLSFLSFVRCPTTQLCCIMFSTLQIIYFLKAKATGNQYRPVLTQYCENNILTIVAEVICCNGSGGRFGFDFGRD